MAKHTRMAIQLFIIMSLPLLRTPVVPSASARLEALKTVLSCTATSAVVGVAKGGALVWKEYAAQNVVRKKVT